MKRADVFAALAISGTVLLAATPSAMQAFRDVTVSWPLLSSMIKFAILPTFGECLALRISTGEWNRNGFGVLARAVAWAFFGLCIKIAFTVFASGGSPVLALLGFSVETGLGGILSLEKVLTALAVSVTMNMTFGPVLMLSHKLSDMHIADCGGSAWRYLTTCPDMAGLFRRVDWDVMWGFVFKKTLPLFWIPAHTITFLLPPWLRILAAAALGVCLGLILALASLRAKSNP